MPSRPYRAKLRLAHKRYEAILSRMLKPDRGQTYDFESMAAAIAIAETHLRKFPGDGEAEVWEREADGVAVTRKVWPDGKKTAKAARKGRR